MGLVTTFMLCDAIKSRYQMHQITKCVVDRRAALDMSGF